MSLTPSDQERLAPFATKASAGRFAPEPESRHRSPFQRDRDRIIHSTPFRRLMHKTQVFVAHEGDSYRTRLTHTLEVAQIARTIARTFRLDEDLAEAIALAHDLGHTPFGHAGERALDRAMAPYGGFDHNAQALRIVTLVERRYAEFDGLNLTRETLAGIVKHNGPLTGPFAPSDTPLPWGVREFPHFGTLKLGQHAALEAQIAAVADDIAYNTHDLDDGLRAGLFELDTLATLPLIGPVLAKVDALYPKLAAKRRRHETLRRVFGLLVEDVLVQTRRQLKAHRPQSAADIEQAPVMMAGFSAPVADELSSVREFLFERMYRHEGVVRVMQKAEAKIEQLFTAFMDDPELLPEGPWRAKALVGGPIYRARSISDYIAGMTDPFAQAEFARIFGAERGGG